MSDAVFLDTGPLGILVKHPTKPEVIACSTWLLDCVAAGRNVYFPEIVDYELRRELLQSGFSHSIARLDKLKAKLIYLPLTTDAMLLAAGLWAQTRRGGQATSDPKSFDGDVILAAQMVSTGIPGITGIVATGNAKHLGRLVRCADWSDISPAG